MLWRAPVHPHALCAAMVASSSNLADAERLVGLAASLAVAAISQGVVGRQDVSAAVPLGWGIRREHVPCEVCGAAGASTAPHWGWPLLLGLLRIAPGGL